MFTGLISHVGEVAGIETTASGRAITIRAPWRDLAVGESIAVDGVCLSVTAIQPDGFVAVAVGATVDRTTAGAWHTGTPVNLERALRLGDRLGGHIVQGHVDGVGEVVAARGSGDRVMLDVSLWDGAEVLCIPQGSIALDGVSLTIQDLAPGPVVTIALIELTQRHTTLGSRRAGDRVNVELDVIGKYVRQSAAPWSAIAGFVH